MSFEVIVYEAVDFSQLVKYSSQGGVIRVWICVAIVYLKDVADPGSSTQDSYISWDTGASRIRPFSSDS